MTDMQQDQVRLIKDTLKEKRDELNLTNQDIADRSGVPLNTVTNYFSSRSKSPSLYTVGPICAVLGVSIDNYFGIFEEKENTKEDDKKDIIIREQEELISQLNDKIRIYKKVLNISTTVIFLLLAACAFIAFCRPIQLA